MHLKVIFGNRVLAFALFCLSCQLIGAKSSANWEITATDTAAYFPPAFGNGLTGGVLDQSGLRPSRLFQATVFDEGTADHVSTLRPVISPLALSINVNGSTAMSQWSQTLEMDRGQIVTHYYIDDVAIETRFCALRQMPHAIMAEVNLHADNDATIVIVNHPYFPPTLTDTLRRNATIWCDDGGKRLSRRSARYSSSTMQLASAAIMIPQSDQWTYFGADTLTIKLKRGQSASMWAVGIECSSADFKDPFNEADRQAIYAARQGLEALRQGHDSAWHDLWKGDIEIIGNDELALQVRSALYNIYSSLRAGSRRSIAPMGLTSDKYYGHIFWDADTWIFPAMAILNPEIARAMIDYRIDRLPAARQRAAAYGYAGAMFPWESDHNGEESTPTFALTGPLEHHITADVARAAWLYYCATADTAWLRRDGYPLLRDCADFWVSRSQRDDDGRFSIRNVVGADEYAIGVDNDAFTNAAARRALEYAVQACEIIGEKSDPRWTEVATGMRFEMMPDGVVIREHASYNGQTTKQADVELLAFPLGMMTDPQQITSNIDYYAARIDSVGGPAMSHSAMAVNYARMNRPETAAQLIERSFRPNLRGPFLQLSETPGNDETYFMTAAGGLIQAILFGYAGYDITPAGITANPRPLPSAIKSIIVRRPATFSNPDSRPTDKKS